METMGIDAERMGRILKKLRGEKTQEAVAKDIGITKSALSMYERGERIPRDNIKIRISSYYNTPIYEIFYAKKTHDS